MKPILITAGTRPEAIKIAPIIEELQKQNIEFIFVWSGQHYDYEMSKIFFEQLELPEPDENLNIQSGTHAEQTAKAVLKLEKTIQKHKPSIVVSEGDTNTVAATAITSIKCLVPFAHVEAGLRSWNMTMPEEINRKIADTIATLHFAPTKLAALNLLFEGTPPKGLHITGNTIVDVIYRHKNIAKKVGERLLNKLNLEKEEYLLVTIHRAENVDNTERLKNILTALNKLSEEYKLVFPIHPRTEKRITQLGLNHLIEKTIQLKPLSYFEFIGLLMNCATVLTDSGGIQEEAFTLKIPTVTIRYNTERPETLTHKINVLAGTETQKIIELTHKQIENLSKIKKVQIDNPLGNGHAGKRITKILKQAVENGLEIKEPDLRKTPLIKYKLINHQLIRNFEQAEILVEFDETGTPIIPTFTLLIFSSKGFSVLGSPAITITS